MSYHHLAALTIATLVSTQALTSPQCSIKPPAGASDAALTKLAKLTKDDAAKIALATIKAPAKTSVSSSELEAEHGCLIWSFDIRIDGKSGLREVNVDAGDGHIISSSHEGPLKEAVEKAAEAKETQSKTDP